MSENPQSTVKTEPPATAVPRWHWLLSKDGIATLVAIFALIASVTFNIIQLRAKQEMPDFQPVGTFASGELMDAIIQQCKRGSTDSPVPRLQIVADFAAYGAFSHPQKFNEYVDILRRRSDNGKNSVSCVFLSEQRRRDVVLLEFKDFDALLKTKPFLEKAQKYLVSDYPLRAAKELGLATKALSPETLTMNEFVDLNIRADNLLIADLRNWGVKVKFYPYLLTVHAWSGTRDDALMAIVDFEGVVDETGFLARRQVAENIQKVFEITDKGSVP